MCIQPPDDYEAHEAGKVKELVPLIVSAVFTFANVTHRLLLHETIETHRAITDAISRHDHTEARCAMEMHLIYNHQMIMKLMKQEKTY